MIHPVVILAFTILLCVSIGVIITIFIGDYLFKNSWKSMEAKGWNKKDAPKYKKLCYVIGVIVMILLPICGLTIIAIILFKASGIPLHPPKIF